MEYRVANLNEVMKLIRKSNYNRIKRETYKKCKSRNMNSLSSRSHLLFQLLFETTDSSNHIQRTKCNIVDLAGN